MIYYFMIKNHYNHWISQKLHDTIISNNIELILGGARKYVR